MNEDQLSCVPIIGSEFIISPSGISKGVKAVKASLSAAERGKVVGETPAEAKSLQSNTPKSNQGEDVTLHW